MKKLIAIASAAVLGLGVAACDSSTENAMEEEAEAVDEASEVQAEVVEDTVGEAEAEAVEEAGEEQADAMEEAADDSDGGAPE